MSFVAAEGKEEITLNVMLPDFNSDKDWVTLEDGNPVLQFIYEQTGVKLNITWVADAAYGEKTSLTVANPDGSFGWVMSLNKLLHPSPILQNRSNEYLCRSIKGSLFS